MEEQKEKEACEKEVHEKTEQLSKRMEMFSSSAAECILDWLEKEGADKPREEKLKAIAGRIEATCMMGIMTVAIM